MKTYIFTYERKTNDINGNPRHWVTVYRVMRNAPKLLAFHQAVGYMGKRQRAYVAIAKNENWAKGPAGVREAFKYNKIQLIEV